MWVKGSGNFLITFNYNNERLMIGHDIKTIGDENATNLLVFSMFYSKLK